VERLNFGLFVLRVVFGVFLSAHGFNKVLSGNGLAGTARWFGSIGMRWPRWQARIAATTEIGAGLMFAAGLLTPLSAAGIIGVMLVAIIVEHWKVGFFVFRPNQGWEYCASILVVAFVVATIGPGEWSLDHALDIEVDGWVGGAGALALGVVTALAQIAICYRPVKTPA
jgi:putative oxidoreductase